MLLVQIQGMRGKDWYGCILDERRKGSVFFCGIHELILWTDALSGDRREREDRMGFPSLRDGPGVSVETLPGNDQTDMQWEAENIHRIRGESLLIQIIGKQNKSLQGRIQGRMIKGRNAYFRSALELMHLLSEIPLRELNGQERQRQ